jgi:hypothetical protein
MANQCGVDKSSAQLHERGGLEREHGAGDQHDHADDTP